MQQQQDGSDTERRGRRKHSRDRVVSRVYQIADELPADSALESGETTQIDDNPSDDVGGGASPPATSVIDFSPAASPPASPPYSLDLEGDNPPCPSCTRNVPCLFFYGQVFFSFVILLISVAGLAGLIAGKDICFNNAFYSNLVTMVVSLWIGRSVKNA
jgi:hypothetical protein